VVVGTTVAIAGLLSDCVLPDYAAFGVQQVIQPGIPATAVVSNAGSPQITVSWQSPSSSAPGDIDSYRLYFRHLEGDKWIMLSEVPAGDPLRIVVTHRELGDGYFEFGVAAKNLLGESQIHRSSESTASPGTGWVLNWKVKK
jgi:hypothetical protein